MLSYRRRPGCIIASRLACGCESQAFRRVPSNSLTTPLHRYSTMDNVDGKQARRTSTSSPLGELFEYVPVTIRRAHPSILMAWKPRNRFFELHLSKPPGDSSSRIRCQQNRSFYCPCPRPSDVLFHLGNLPHAHALPGLLQRPYRYA